MSIPTYECAVAPAREHGPAGTMLVLELHLGGAAVVVQ